LASASAGIEDTDDDDDDDDVVWIQWPLSDESEAVGYRDAGDRSIEEVDGELMNVGKRPA
jgi:hypothetical protein